MEFSLSVGLRDSHGSGYCSKQGTPHSALPRLEPACGGRPPCPHGEGVRGDISRLHLDRTGDSFEYAHVLSHMNDMGGAGISAL
jgi:hypothetical protein